MGKYLLVFASDEKYLIATNRLVKQAKSTKIFDDVFYIHPENFPEDFKSFIDSHFNLFRNYTRGFGFWIWKPFFINWYFKNVLKDGDILFYADSGCEISIFGKELLIDYFNFAEKYGGVFFSSKHKEKFWTKMDLICMLESFQHINTKQIAATFFILQNNSNNRKLVSTWLEIATTNNYHYIDDTLSLMKNSIGFREHRHDQSILSLLVKKEHFMIIDFDFYYNSKLYYPNSYILKYPIHALRNLTNISILDTIIENSEKKNILSLKSFIIFILSDYYGKSKHFILITYIRFKNFFKKSH
jgi:hypothetical protein